MIMYRALSIEFFEHTLQGPVPCLLSLLGLVIRSQSPQLVPFKLY